jgi:hypothetical protein
MRTSKIGSRGHQRQPPCGASPGIHPAKESALTFAKCTPPSSMDKTQYAICDGIRSNHILRKKFRKNPASWYSIFKTLCDMKQKEYFLRLACNTRIYFLERPRSLGDTYLT